MKGMKKTIGIVLVIALIAVGIYTFVAVKSETSSEKVQLRMAHGQAADSEIGETIEYLSDLEDEDISKNLEVDIYPIAWSRAFHGRDGTGRCTGYGESKRQYTGTV